MKIKQEQDLERLKLKVKKKSKSLSNKLWPQLKGQQVVTHMVGNVFYLFSKPLEEVVVKPIVEHCVVNKLIHLKLNFMHKVVAEVKKRQFKIVLVATKVLELIK